MMKNNTHYASIRQHPKWPLNPIKGCYQLAAGLLLTLLSLTSFSMMTAAAWAQQYQPPAGEPPVGPRGSNGTRDGCGETYGIPLTALAPTQHVGRTTSTTPTFVWFIPATSPYRINLAFYSVNEDQQRELLHQVESIESASGIVNFTLPADEFDLSPGQHYQWQVSIACVADSPRYDQSFVSTLEIVEPPTAIAAALTVAQTPLEKAEIYAEAGYWYDALREAMIASDNSDPDGIATSLLHELAKSEGGLHGYYLIQISEILNDTGF